MPKIDKLKAEADEIKGYLFAVVTFVLMLFGGLGALFMKQLEHEKLQSGIVVGVFIVLLLIKISAIIFIKLRGSFSEKLSEIEKE